MFIQLQIVQAGLSMLVERSMKWLQCYLGLPFLIWAIGGEFHFSLFYLSTSNNDLKVNTWLDLYVIISHPNKI